MYITPTVTLRSKLLAGAAVLAAQALAAVGQTGLFEKSPHFFFGGAVEHRGGHVDALLVMLLPDLPEFIETQSFHFLRQGRGL